MFVRNNISNNNNKVNLGKSGQSTRQQCEKATAIDRSVPAAVTHSQSQSVRLADLLTPHQTDHLPPSLHG